MKQQFRHKDGCCICATKSSTTRFQLTTDYEASFAQVFGAKARNRSGHICNACILCVRRGTGGIGGGGGGGSPSCAPSSGTNKAPYANVVDSRRGTGPKHMKQISKRNRRREQREAAAAAAAKAANNDGVNGRLGSGEVACAAASLTESTPCGRDLNGSGCGGGGGPSGCGSGARDDSGSGGGGGAVGIGAAGLSGQIGQDGEFRAPLAPASSGATGRRRQQYYKKRVIMQPVKIPDSKEIGELFQDVMQSRCMAQSDGPLSFQQVHSAFLTTKRRRLLASGGSETASVTSTEAPESFTSDTPSAGSVGPPL